MAPIHAFRKDSDSGSESGSESEANESSVSESSSEGQRNRSNQGSGRSKSRSPSPANSQVSVSSQSPGTKSRRDSESSCSLDQGSEFNRSFDRSAGEEPVENHDSKFRSNSLSLRSPSIGSEKSGSESADADEENQRSRSESPAEKSNASPKNSDLSRSPSPGSQSERENSKKNSRSRSPSEGSNASRQSSGRSRSPSIDSESDKKSEKQFHSPMSNHSEQKNNEGVSSRENSRPSSRTSQRTRSSSKNRSDSDVNSNKNSPRKSISPKRKSRSISPIKSQSASPHSNGEEFKPGESTGSKSPKSAHAEENQDDADFKEEIIDREGEQSHSGESDSELVIKNDVKKRKRTIGSDESGSDKEIRKKKLVIEDKKDDREGSLERDNEISVDAEALFGKSSDISSEDEGKKHEKLRTEIDEKEDAEEDAEDSQSKGGVNEMDENDKEDKENEPEDQQMETRIDVEVPKITINLGRDLHFIKLPNFLSVETRPFDKTNYEDEIDEEETLDEEGRARLKLKVENTIRWREVPAKDGELIKQSNARFVRWSDGSMSLHLGSEIFDVYKQSLHGDHNHLFIRQGTGLQGQAVFRTKLTFRPHSTESFTHRKMTMSLADRSQKATGIKVLSLVGKDPEAHRGELIKKEEERLKASMRRASKQKRVREKAANRGISVNYLEPDRYNDVDSDDEVISINAIKKQHQNKVSNRRGDRPHIYSSDEEGSDIEMRRARRLDKAKALKESDSDDDSGGGGGSQSRTRSSSRED